MIILLILSAVLLTLTFPNSFYPFGLWPLAFVFAVPFFYVLDRCPSRRRRVFAGGVFALVFYSLLIHWFVPYSPAGFVLFLFALCLQPLFFAFLYERARLPRGFSLVYLPALWVVSEGAREIVMRGFSWGLGASLIFDPVLSSLIHCLGSRGVSFVIILANLCVYRLLAEKKQRGLCVMTLTALAVLTAFCVFNRFSRERPLSTLHILSIQPNIDYRDKQMVEKADENFDQQISITEQALRHDPVDLVLWPETAVTTDVLSNQRMRQTLKRIARQYKTNILVGTALYRDGKNYNSAVLFSRRGEVKRVYDKRALVPFTEYLPLGGLGRLAARWTGEPSYDFAAGKTPGLVDLPVWGGRYRLGVLICSEDTIGAMFEESVRQGAQLIVILSNDGWFQAKEAKLLHAQNALVSSLEHRVPVVRATNTGWTNYFDGRGGFQRSTGRIDRQGVFRYDAEIRSEMTGRAFLKDNFAAFSLCFVIMGQVMGMRKKK